MLNAFFNIGVREIEMFPFFKIMKEDTILQKTSDFFSNEIAKT